MLKSLAKIVLTCAVVFFCANAWAIPLAPEKIRAKLDSAQALFPEQKEVAYELATGALALAEESGDALMTATAHLVLGKFFQEDYAYEKALQHLSSANEGAAKMGDGELQFEALYEIGRINSQLGMNTKAAEAGFNALKIAEGLKAKPDIALVSNLIGIIKKSQGQDEEALVYFEKALELAVELKDTALTATLYNNIGSGYKNRKEYAKAREYFMKAAEINRMVNNLQYLGYNYNNISNIYEETGDLENALLYQQKSMKLKQEAGDGPGLTVSFLNLSIIYMKQGNYQKSYDHILQAEEYAKRYNENDFLRDIYSYSARILSKLGRHKEAYEKMSRLQHLSDSLARIDRQVMVSEIEARYEREQIESENALLKKEMDLKQARIERKDSLLTLLWLGVGMLLLLILVGFTSYRHRAKANARLAGQNESIRVQKQKLEEANQKLELAQKDKDLFFSTLSHDMRSPVNAILAISDLLVHGDIGDEEKTQVQLVKFSAKTLLSLVNDIVDYSRIEAGKIQFENIEFNLQRHVLDITDSFGVLSREKDVGLNAYFQLRHQVFEGDPTRLSQILYNIIGNALKFTQQGHIHITVKEKPGNGNSVLCFTVADTGIGIAKDKLESIFDYYTQQDASIYRKFGGTGLGLAITKELVELQGGTIEVSSEEGKGSEFRFTLPMKHIA